MMLQKNKNSYEMYQYELLLLYEIVCVCRNKKKITKWFFLIFFNKPWSMQYTITRVANVIKKRRVKSILNKIFMFYRHNKIMSKVYCKVSYFTKQVKMTFCTFGKEGKFQINLTKNYLRLKKLLNIKKFIQFRLV